MTAEISVSADLAELVEHAAEQIARLAREAVAAHGRFTVALSGGSTPKPVYERLACRQDVPWSRSFFFFGDERAVPPDHSDSNFHMVQKALFAPARVAEGQVFRVQGELPPVKAAIEYEARMQRFFNAPLPRFDLVFLGLGSNLHTASLFPRTAALEERQRWFIESWVEELGAFRLTMTYPVINAATAARFLVAGADKAEAVKTVVEGHPPVRDCPACGVHPINGSLGFWLDRQAARLLISPEGATLKDKT